MLHVLEERAKLVTFVRQLLFEIRIFLESDLDEVPWYEKVRLSGLITHHIIDIIGPG